jgi:CheY-like chemotaxis protein
VARRLRARANSDRLLLIAVTGYGGEVVRKRTGEVGFDCHFVKPVDLSELQTLLEEAAV